MLRKIVGLTQKEFCKKLNITQSYLSALEVGKRELPLSLVLKIKEEFGLSTENFLYGDITICDIHIKNDDSITKDIIENSKRIERGEYIDDYEEMRDLHRKFTRNILVSNNIDDMSFSLENTGAMFSILETIIEQYSIKSLTREAFILYKKSLISREQLMTEYRKAIEINKTLYNIISKNENALNPIYKRICEFDFSHNKIYSFDKDENGDLIC